MKHAYKIYELIIALLALFSIAMTIFDFAGTINLATAPWNVLNDAILIVFTFDYVTRLIAARDKLKFFKHNIFDLLAIIPFSSVFSFFRLSRLVRVMQLFRIFKLVRLIGFIGKAQHQLKRFGRTNGFMYLLWACIALLLVSATVYAIAENVSWGNAFWWAIVTATTVGYGDLSPHTWVGRAAAILLMIVGVGFIGILTSTIVNFFGRDQETKFDKLYNQMKKLEEQNNRMEAELKSLKKHQDYLNHRSKQP
ncbi:ion transporter [Lactiplantibacillus garii]|uniref:Ion transporter n=1 Tax=Lactiplantibacillus garii TaxID=2306423 RepID=A0A426D5A4_9LACO|nr:ion transporter [Lactiplantibacillus garii]RRK09782.1 ion transporter [Lactiplantibacillus garii]